MARSIEVEVFLGLRLPELIALAEAIGRAGWPEEPPLLLPATRPG